MRSYFSVNCTWSEWEAVSQYHGERSIGGEWSIEHEWPISEDQSQRSNCSEKCGWGNITYTRKVIQPALHGGHCLGNENRTEPCNEKDCPGNFRYILDSILVQIRIINVSKRNINIFR